MRNVEIKAKLTDLQYKNICETASELSGGPPTMLRQDDTFYNVPNGRLKMRFYADSSATLVRYDRVNEGGPKLSNYEVLLFSACENDKAQLLDEMLKKCLGVRGQVVKRRYRYMVGQTRIHIDTVLGLGDFIELEVLLRADQSVEDGQSIAKELQKKLGIRDADLIDCAYVDLLDN